MPPRIRGADRGSATAEFAIVAPMVLLVGLAVLQFVLFLHVRGVAQTAVAEGARIASLAGANTVDGQRETRRLLALQVSPGSIKSVTARSTTVSGVGLIETTARLRVPLIGLLAPVDLTVRGHAVAES